MYCVFLGRAVGTVNAPAGSVDTAQLAADAVTGAKIADDAISDEHLDPTAITGQTAETTIADDDLILLSDTSASAALKKMTRANFVSGVGGVNTPMFSARLGSNSSSISQNTTTKVVCGTEEFDTDSAYDTSTGRFTVPSGEGGKYVFVSQVAFNTTNSNQGFEVRHYKNGSGVSSNQVYADSSSTFSGSILTSLQNTIVIDLSASDYVETYAVAFNGGDFVFDATNSMTFFRGYKLIG
jgi:hypothetical protein